jgi:hypothetical protein
MYPSNRAEASHEGDRVIGKPNAQAFGVDGSTFNHVFGRIRNTRDTVPG